MSRGVEGPKPDVFQYQDYRQYLKAVFQQRKAADARFSMSKFACSLGFSSHSGLAMVLNGQRSLRQPYLDRCVKQLKLGLKERLYFESIVNVDALSPAKKRQLKRDMEFLKNKWAPPDSPHIPSLFDFAMVHQLLCLHKRFMTLEEIFSELPYIKEKDTLKGILEYMVAREYIKKSQSGAVKIVKTVLIAEDETPSTSARQLHHECLDRAHLALETADLEDREFQTYLMTVDSKDIPKIKKAIKESVMKIIKSYEADLDGDTIIQMHSHMLELVQRKDSYHEC